MGVTRYRLLGVEAYRAREYERAFEYFRRAAYYADKPSQGMVAEMLWTGQGVPRDGALAYAWMDLAAERGYRGFLTLRERYWTRLDEPARARALEEGGAVYARYGDEAARPRIDRELRHARRQITGSRTGHPVGHLRIEVPGPNGTSIGIDGTRFYDPVYWDPQQYQAWHDQVWMEPRTGNVDVGELESLRTPDEEDDAP
ncbi:hypothetical protein LY625_06135 [Lysobacter sp. GX 14042]|uniref:hypothetical protein n=1 Tax=Lysobacter sp. GX 14042 TaxID=2907155 RepID=UPI001F1EAC88|nr:hypothetical protein [Lysobacter sp. GX 14042]MCE7032199.1 hypothetical protein [Lysobacter sp. GX 14042]